MKCTILALGLILLVSHFVLGLENIGHWYANVEYLTLAFVEY